MPCPEHCTREVTKAERKGRRAEQQHDAANLEGLSDVVTPLLAREIKLALGERGLCVQWRRVPEDDGVLTKGEQHRQYAHCGAGELHGISD